MKIIIDIPESTYKVFKNLSKIIGVLVYEKDILILIKAVRHGTPLAEWLSSFNTDSAPICFNKIQELKRECEKE